MGRITKVFLAGLCCAAVLSGCGNKAVEPAAADTTVAAAETETTAPVTETAAETAEQTAEQEPVKGDKNKKAILVVSAGTSDNESRAKTLDAIEARVAEAYPDFTVRSAYTNQSVIDTLKSRDGLVIDTVEEAVQKLVDEGYGTLIVQPTLMMAGIEYYKMNDQVDPYLQYFPMAVVGEPLLSYIEDYDAVTKFLMDDTAEYVADDTSIVFMGRGSSHSANEIYASLEESLADAGAKRYFVGTAKAEPTLDDVLEKVAEAGSEKVVLFPLTITAGHYAMNDMAGDDADSWKSRFESAGYDVDCVVKGLGEYMGIQDLIVTHVKESLDFLPSY